jgi:hypothetical protein
MAEIDRGKPHPVRLCAIDDRAEPKNARDTCRTGHDCRKSPLVAVASLASRALSLGLQVHPEYVP